MTNEIIRAIEQKVGIPGLAALLAERLSGSELNSLLLEVFSERLKDTPPEVLLKQYQANRFVQPADTDMVRGLHLELRTLEFLRGCAFQPIELSPAAQLGSCSIMGTVSQDKIISATRNTEILADATNSMALHIAALKKSGRRPVVKGAGIAVREEEVLRFCTVHRHLRTQQLKEKGHTPHFKIGCMVTAGRDSGDYRFEATHLSEHLRTLDHLLREVLGIKRLRIKLQKRDGYPNPDRLLQTVADQLKKEQSALAITTEEPATGNNYYKGIQFKVIIEMGDREVEIADGGFVDWTQKLLGNHKERLLISGFGLSLLDKSE
jgi:hypothetical protein